MKRGLIEALELGDVIEFSVNGPGGAIEYFGTVMYITEHEITILDDDGIEYSIDKNRIGNLLLHL